MIFGDEKPFQMARSILPSKNREAARKDKTSTRKSERRAGRALMKALLRCPDDYDDEAGLSRDAPGRMSGTVSWRRAGDKLNHFERWAVRKTHLLPRDDRLSHLRPVLPNGLIGEHALIHLRQLPELLTARQLNARELERAGWTRRWRKSSRMNRGLQATLLRRIIEESNWHRALNRWLARGETADVRTRKLLGLHDVRAFLRDVQREPHDALGALDSFLRHVWEYGAPPPEALVALESLDSDALSPRAFWR
jgi:hypothetical protein